VMRDVARRTGERRTENGERRNLSSRTTHAKAYSPVGRK
jgi:hypothetical protein